MDSDHPTLMSAAWNMPLSRVPPLFATALAPSRYTYELIKQSGEYSVSFLGFAHASTLIAIGRTSGRSLDKARALELDFREPHRIGTPVLLRAYAAYECLLEKVVPAGDHDLIIGRIAATHWQQDAFENGRPIWSKSRPALYLGSNTFLEPGPLQEVRIDTNRVIEHCHSGGSFSRSPKIGQRSGDSQS